MSQELIIAIFTGDEERGAESLKAAQKTGQRWLDQA